MNTLLKALILGFLLIAYQPLFSEANVEGYDSTQAKPKYKKLLQDTVWIVPPSTLLAYEYLNGHHVPVSDQTVWVINEYRQGYFFGDSYTTLNGAPSSHRKILGSITPSGDVYISFYPLSNSVQDTDIIEGIGKFEKRRGKYFFTMQMNSAETSLAGLSHWSYMISVKPRNYFYKHLPGVDISVPEFISQF